MSPGAQCDELKEVGVITKTANVRSTSVVFNKRSRGFCAFGYKGLF